MISIALLSDTHSFLDPQIPDYLHNTDEIWHAGDIGDIAVLDTMESLKPVRAVFGNIDGGAVRRRIPENLFFEVEGFRVWMTHIGGAPPRYNPQVFPRLKAETPDIFICGHSHILRVMRDEHLQNMLYINPGAAGKEGFHKIRTMLRFELHQKTIRNMEVIELGKRGAIN
jgi:putative phosphoesterase